MFKKLLSNLPFNPSLIGQVGFYAQRLRKESFVRGLGVATMVLALFVQTFAVISPPESSLAESTNDIVKGGFTSRAEAVRDCTNNSQDFKTILAYYKVTCEQLSDTTKTVTKNIKSTDYNKQLDSLGRNPQGASIYRPLTGKTNPTDEYRVNIPGLNYPLFMRNLWAWDSYDSSEYKVLQTRNSDGELIFILYNCGNVVTVDKYQPKPDPQPEPEPEKLPEGNFDCTILTPEYLGDRTYKFTISTSGSNYNVSRYEVKFGDNSAPDVKASTAKKHSVFHKYTRDGTYKIHGSVYGSVRTETGAQKAAERQCYSQITHTSEVVVQEPVDACPNIPGNQSSARECYPCPESESQNDTEACLTYEKFVRNDTQGIENADKTIAKPGDILIYTLRVNNKSQYEFPDFKFTENMNDIFEYANIYDAAGGELNSLNILSWQRRNLPADKTVDIAFKVQVKEKIPQTPTSSSDQSSYDLCMANAFYDASVIVCVEPPVSKQIETVVTTMPNTGPGETMAGAFAVVMIMGYFYSRNKLMAEELTIIRDEFASGGTQ